MNQVQTQGLPLTYRAVRDEVPTTSGVYTIYTPQRWVYVGESDDLRRSLFQQLNEPAACLNRFGPLSFSFEVVPPPERGSRQQVLAAALAPACPISSPAVTPAKA